MEPTARTYTSAVLLRNIGPPDRPSEIPIWAVASRTERTRQGPAAIHLQTGTV